MKRCKENIFKMTPKQNHIVETIIDGGITAIATGISIKYPEFAGLMGALTGAAVTISQAKFRCLFSDVFSMVDRLRQENVNMEYLSSPQFIHEVELLLYEKSLEDLEQKRVLYANYFESCCRCFSTEKQNMQRYYTLLKDIDVIEFAILKLLPDREATVCTAHRIHERCTPQFEGLTLDDINMRIESLETKCLVRGISSKEVEEKYLRRLGRIVSRREYMCYYKTTLGRKFEQFIEKEY